jgi:hypothetical protein
VCGNTHRIPIVFTARFNCLLIVLLYGWATVTLWGAGKTRRWQLAIAAVAALSLFTAVTTGWASRGAMLAQVAAPLPAALSHGTHVGVNVGHARLGDRSQPTSDLAHGSSPTHQKQTKNAWMTRDRPPTWTRMSPNSIWSPLPASFAASEFRLAGTHSAAPVADLADQDILTQLCVARR